jgi:hypothetical protein
MLARIYELNIEGALLDWCLGGFWLEMGAGAGALISPKPNINAQIVTTNSDANNKNFLRCGRAFSEKYRSDRNARGAIQ